MINPASNRWSWHGRAFPFHLPEAYLAQWRKGSQNHAEAKKPMHLKNPTWTRLTKCPMETLRRAGAHHWLFLQRTRVQVLKWQLTALCSISSRRSNACWPLRAPGIYGQNIPMHKIILEKKIFFGGQTIRAWRQHAQRNRNNQKRDKR